MQKLPDGQITRRASFWDALRRMIKTSFYGSDNAALWASLSARYTIPAAFFITNIRLKYREQWEVV